VAKVDNLRIHIGGYFKFLTIMSTVENYVGNLINRMVVVDRDLSIDGLIFLIIVRISMIYLFS
jgi:hypothetical protein